MLKTVSVHFANVVLKRKEIIYGTHCLSSKTYLNSYMDISMLLMSFTAYSNLTLGPCNTQGVVAMVTMAIVDNVDDVFTDSDAVIAYRHSIEILLRKLTRNQSTI